MSLSVDERVAIEEAEASAGERPTLPTESAAYLWLGQFISSFCNVASFGSVMRMVESWRDGMSAELRVECRSLTYARCQVRVYICCFWALLNACLRALVVKRGAFLTPSMIANVVPVLLSLQHASNNKMYSTESETRIGHALAAAIGITDPLVVGRVTQI